VAPEFICKWFIFFIAGLIAGRTRRHGAVPAGITLPAPEQITNQRPNLTKRTWQVKVYYGKHGQAHVSSKKSQPNWQFEGPGSPERVMLVSRRTVYNQMRMASRRAAQGGL
jgi:hypothetical protein